MELAEVQTSPLLFSQTLIAIQKRYQLYANILSWLRNVRCENLASDEDRKMLIAKLDGNVADVVHSIYPICPTKLNKNELASTLLNRLSEKRQLLIKLEVEKDDSGVFTEEEELMLVDECLTHCDSNSTDTLKRKEEELMSVDECMDYFDSKSLDTLSSQPTMATVLELFGFNDLRDQQKEIVDAVLKGRDCLAIMPTGGGKSTCYFLPGLMQQGVTIVICPLNALIDDQLTQLVSLGVQATSFPLETLMIESFLNNSSSECAIKFLYLTPEKLCNALKDGNEHNVLKNLMDKLYERKQMLRLIVDEAQCITTWGLDFRKDYGNLSLFRNFFPAVPVLALTGTANVQTRRDITDTLRLRNPFVSVRPCVRDNLKISFTHKKSNDHAFKLMKERLKDDFPNESGIIYCMKKADCVNLSSFLEKEGFSVTFYHGEVPKDEQKRRLANWMSGHVKIICATIAFGMGINKPDVRFVFHLSMPKSMESFYQECGRAGRDGQLASCILFYKFSDYFEQQSLINYDPNGTKVKEIQTAELVILKKMAIFCENRTVCRNVGIASFFDESRRPCDINSLAVCDVCETTDQYVEVDVIEHVRDIVDTIITNWSTSFTISFLVSIFRAKEIDKKRISNSGDVKKFAMYGKGEDWKADNAFRLFQKMLLDNVLEESLVSLPPIPTYAVMRIGSNWPLEEYPVMMIQEEVTEQSNRPKKRFRAE